MEIDESAKPSENIVKSCLAALVSFSCQFMLGALLGQTSTMIPQLKEKDSPIQIDEEYASWIASCSIIGTPVASVLCGPLTDKIGRKAAMRLQLLFNVIGFTIIGVSSNVWEIIIGRSVLSISAGFTFPSMVYISEICGPTHRAYLLAFGTVSSSLGLVYAYTVGAVVNWDLASLITSVIAIIALLYSFLIPESPAWLFKNHKLNEALESLKWLRGEDLNSELELKLLRNSCVEQPTTKVNFVREFQSPTVIKPFLILLIFSFLQSGSGFYVLLYYSVEFMQACNTSFNPQILGIVLGVARLISTIMASIFINKFPRKVMGAASGFSMALCLGIALIFQLVFQNNANVLAQYSVVPAACLVLYVFACGFGVHPLPWTMIFEMYPLHVRGFMCGISYSMNFVFTFVFVKLFYVMMSYLKMQGTMLIFLVSSLVFCLYSLFVLPETRGKTLIEIENGFVPKNSKKEVAPKV